MLTFISAFGDRCSVPVQPPPLPTRNVGVWSSSAEAHTVCAIADDFFSTQLGTDIRLIYMPDSAERKCSAEFAKNNEIVSFADGYPVLVASESSLADLNARIVANGGAAVPMSRFRANLVVTGADAFAEDGWIEFNIGETRLRTAKPCPRCQVTTTDQASGEIRGPEPLLTLATYRDSPGGLRFGSNLMPVTLGKIRVGDTLSLN